MGVCLHRDPVLGNIKLCYFSKAFNRRAKFLFIRKWFIEGVETFRKEGFGNGKICPQGALLGNLQGGLVYRDF
jgi:hypothetical protein